MATVSLPGTFSIGPAHPDDFKSVVALHAVSLLYAFQRDEEELDSMAEAAASVWREVFSRVGTGATDTQVLVVRSGGRIVGVCSAGAISPGSKLRPDAQTCELGHVHFHPGWWGTGIPQPVVGEMMEDRRALDDAAMVAYVKTDNERACRFFEKIGFTHVMDTTVELTDGSVTYALYGTRFA